MLKRILQTCQRVSYMLQVVLENIQLEKELEERKAARKMAAEICLTGKPLLLTGLTAHNQAQPAAVPPTATGSKNKKKRSNGILTEFKQVSPAVIYPNASPLPSSSPPCFLHLRL